MLIESNYANSSLDILLADDDRDDRFFFKLALNEMPFPAQLTTVEDGEKLMNHLAKKSEALPDVLFLDLNMPKKNGSECLYEIKQNIKLKKLKVIIYSTSLHENVADQLYTNGAHYYIQKREFEELKNILLQILPLIQTQMEQPPRANFIFNPVNSKSSGSHYTLKSPLS
jgi:CheY-like chemotaxis protein